MGRGVQCHLPFFVCKTNGSLNGSQYSDCLVRLFLPLAYNNFDPLMVFITPVKIVMVALLKIPPDPLDLLETALKVKMGVLK